MLLTVPLVKGGVPERELLEVVDGCVSGPQAAWALAPHTTHLWTDSVEGMTL